MFILASWSTGKGNERRSRRRAHILCMCAYSMYVRILTEPHSKCLRPPQVVAKEGAFCDELVEHWALGAAAPPLEPGAAWGLLCRATEEIALQAPVRAFPEVRSAS